MNYESLNKTEWKIFFDGLSKCIETREDIYLTYSSSMSSGHHVDSDTTLVGISYDERFDYITVILMTTEHQIISPKKVILGEFERSLISISVEDQDNVVHLIDFNSPIWLDLELLKNNSRSIPAHEIYV